MARLQMTKVELNHDINMASCHQNSVHVVESSATNVVGVHLLASPSSWRTDIV